MNTSAYVLDFLRESLETLNEHICMFRTFCDNDFKKLKVNEHIWICFFCENYSRTIKSGSSSFWMTTAADEEAPDCSDSHGSDTVDVATRFLF